MTCPGPRRPTLRAALSPSWAVSVRGLLSPMLQRGHGWPGPLVVWPGASAPFVRPRVPSGGAWGIGHKHSRPPGLGSREVLGWLWGLPALQRLPVSWALAEGTRSLGWRLRTVCNSWPEWQHSMLVPKSSSHGMTSTHTVCPVAGDPSSLMSTVLPRGQERPSKAVPHTDLSSKCFAPGLCRWPETQGALSVGAAGGRGPACSPSLSRARCLGSLNAAAGPAQRAKSVICTHIRKGAPIEKPCYSRRNPRSHLQPSPFPCQAE